VSLRDAGFEVPVLMYHHVEPAPLAPPPSHPDSYVTPDELAAHLDLLRRRGFTTLTLAAAAAAFHAAEPLPARAVVLTFDDACRCFAEHAAPRLAARGMAATLYAVSGELGGHNRWDAESGERREALLDAAALRELAAAGIEIGCHGATHADLSRLDGGPALERETRGARETLEAALGQAVATFCYPYGRASEAARDAVRAAGFTAAAAIHDHPGARPGDPWAVPRMIVRPREGSFELWLKARGHYPAWSRLPRLGVLAALRRAAEDRR
jgi:peptidoglycan/xylan/chitin deacetylase (PgdA/CDA1 family)